MIIICGISHEIKYNKRYGVSRWTFEEELTDIHSTTVVSEWMPTNAFTFQELKLYLNLLIQNVEPMCIFVVSSQAKFEIVFFMFPLTSIVFR